MNVRKFGIFIFIRFVLEDISIKHF